MLQSTVPKRETLLAVAERLFASKGFQATSVRDIAEQMDIQAGSLYSHIESKEDLLWEIVSRAADRFFKAAEPILASDLLTLEKLRRLVAAHVAVITDNLHAASVYSSEWRHLGEERRRAFAERRNKYEHLVRSLVHDGIREGALADVDEKFAALLILSSINWLYQWYDKSGPMSPDEIARKLTEMLFNGLRRAGH